MGKDDVALLQLAVKRAVFVQRVFKEIPDHQIFTFARSTPGSVFNWEIRDFNTDG